MSQGKTIKKIYKKAGIKAPKGKGEHTVKFHKRATTIKKSNPKMPMSEAYAISMTQIGRDKAVNKSHQNPNYKKPKKINRNKLKSWTSK